LTPGREFLSSCAPFFVHFCHFLAIGTLFVFCFGRKKTEQTETRRCIMTLVKYVPGGFINSAKAMDDMVHRFFDDAFSLDTRFDFKPNADIREDDKAYYIVMDIPGLRKEDLKIKIEENILSISGEKKEEVNKETEKYHLNERLFGHFERNFRLPEDTDREKISATVENGVLTVTIDKAEEKQPKVIDIKIK
jgi:HSP20 family protein